jgi:flavin-dependent dehydrogenase
MRRDVVILGAGPAGSSLAAVLGKLGWDVVLLERRNFPHHKVCGEFLSPESQASLQAMALYPSIATLKPALITQARLVSQAGITVQTALPGCAWGLSRFALDAALATAAQQGGVELRLNVTATAVRQTPGGFEVALRSREGTETIRARAVIAACGRYSLPGLPPHRQPNQDQTPKMGWLHRRFSRGPQDQAYIGIKCHYERVTMPAQVELFFFPGGYAGVNRIEGGRVNFCLLATPAAFARAGRSISAMRQAVVRWNPALGQRLAGGQVVPETEIAVAPVDLSRPALSWDGVACLGDTAVMIPPLCGDGIAMALRSAELCAPLAHDFLQGHLSLTDWQAAYQSSWHAEFDQPVRLGRYLQVILDLPLLSDAFIGLGRLMPPLVTALVQATRSTR